MFFRSRFTRSPAKESVHSKAKRIFSLRPLKQVFDVVFAEKPLIHDQYPAWTKNTDIRNYTTRKKINHKGAEGI
jgi:hypothetical protein